MATTGTHETEIDTTIDALNGDLTAIKPENAVEVISAWRRSLSHSSKDGLKQIADDLGELKDELTSGTLDGKKIGALLKRLGKETTAAAKDADDSVSAKLAQLGQLLTKAGNGLA